MDAIDRLPPKRPRYAAILALSSAGDDLTSSGCPYLLPLIDKTILQHSIELAVRCGAQIVDVLMSDHIHEARQHVGNGERWGVDLRIHTVTTASNWPQTLKTLLGTARAQTRAAAPTSCSGVQPLPSVLLLDSQRLMPNLAAMLTSDGGQFCMWLDESDEWAGATLVPYDDLRRLSEAALNSEGFLDELRKQARLSGTTPRVSESLTILPVEHFLTAQSRVMRGEFPILTEHLRTAEPGVWIGRNTRLHPTAEINAPVFIGSDCDIDEGVVLGPNAVVSQHSLILQDTIARDCLVTSYTGVGEDLNLQDCIVYPNLIYNSRLKINVSIRDEVLTSDLRHSLILKSAGTQAARLSAIAARCLLSCPALIYRSVQSIRGRFPQLTAIEIQRESQVPGQNSYATLVVPKYIITPVDRPIEQTAASQWKDLFLRIVPALNHVATGQLRWCGISGRTAAAFRLVPEYWRETLQHQTPGLITEWLVQYGPAATQEQRLVCDVWMAVSQSRWQRLRLFARYMKTLVVGPESVEPESSLKTQPAELQNGLSLQKYAEASESESGDEADKPLNDSKSFRVTTREIKKDKSPCPI